MARKDRRKTFLSRGKKFEVSRVQGYYSKTWHGQPAFIRLYLDKIYAPVPRYVAWSKFVAFVVIGRVLFHELGHHIHATARPEYKEKEDVAEVWSKKLMRNAVRKRYWHVAPFVKPVGGTIVAVLKSYLFVRKQWRRWRAPQV
jgi:hypothetical protein